MSEKVVAVYENLRMARSAVRELVEYGFEPEQIRVAARTGSQSFEYLEGPLQSGVVRTGGLPAGEIAGARFGAAIGAAAGAVAGILYTGQVNWILSLLLGVLLGGLALSLVGRAAGALLGLGIPDEEAAQYAESIRRGRVQVEVDAEAYSANMLRALLCRTAMTDRQTGNASAQICQDQNSSH